MCKVFNIYMWAEQYLVYDWIRLYAHCDTTRRNSLSAIHRNADGYSQVYFKDLFDIFKMHLKYRDLNTK